MKKLNQSGFAHFLIPAVLVIVGVASYGSYRVMNSYAATSDSVLQLGTEKGCWLSGRVWGKTGSKDTTLGCAKTCRITGTTYIEKTANHPGFCKGHIAVSFTPERCTKDLHRYYVESLGCGRKPNQKDAVAKDYCQPGYPYYNANYTNEAEDTHSLVDFCEQSKKVAQKNEAKGTPGQNGTSSNSSDNGGSGTGSNGGGNNGNSGDGGNGGNGQNGGNGGNNTTPPKLSGSIRVIQFNMHVTDSAAQFKSDYNTVLARKPDVVSLNEAYRLSQAQMAVQGYSAWRSIGSYDQRETPVVWRSDLWKPIKKGTKQLSTSGLNGGKRYANWVTLQSKNNPAKVFTFVSVHLIQASTASKARSQVLATEVSKLNDLVLSRSNDGAVILSGDFNVHYQTDAKAKRPGFPYVGLKKSNSISTFELLGQPSNGWGTGDGGGNLDYQFVTIKKGLMPIHQEIIRGLNSDHNALFSIFEYGH